jgi:hypothetical protein
MNAMSLARETKSENVENPNLALYSDGIRARKQFLATARFTYLKGFRFGIMAEYQRLPEDSTTIVPLSATWIKYRGRQSQGWQAGAEMGYEGVAWNHHLVLSHGQGDVKMAWSSPDFVYVADAPAPDVEWTREGSALSQAVYGAASCREGGAWTRERGCNGGIRQKKRVIPTPRGLLAPTALRD